jgi:competence protein ComEA
VRALIAIAAAGIVAAVVLLHPAAPPSVAATAWASASPLPRHPSIAPTAAGPMVVYVAGEVTHPGVYSLPSGSRIEAAVRRAGGTRPDADPLAVNLAERVHDGEEIAVPARGSPPLARPRRAPSPHPRRGGRSARRAVPAPPAAVDLNTADETALAALPGIGPELASRIVAFREANGSFASADELLDISGITQHRYDAIAPYVLVH